VAGSSDFEKPFFNLISRLSDVYHSKTNISLFNNTFHRFLSKTELESIIGVIGEKNQNAITDRQLPELTPHRQAFQLQPLLYKKIATVDHVASHNDLLLAVDRLGIDVSKFNEWGKVKQFNFIPPIDIDKLINFSDYYWYDPSVPKPQPQYITMKNKCSIATSRLNEKLSQLLNTLEHSINGIQSSTNSFRIDDDYTSVFDDGLQFNVINSLNNTGLWTVASTVFDGQFTFISTVEFIDLSVVDGTISLQNQIQQYQDDVIALCVPTINWIQENRWVHITDIPNINLGIRASFPIIEYFPNLELNEWTFTNHVWKYRQSSFFDWTDVTEQPTIIELGKEIILNTINTICVKGDITQHLVSGETFQISNSTNNDGVYTIDIVSYSNILNQTNITVLEVLNVPPFAEYGVFGPITTQFNHDWLSSTEHWAYVQEEVTVPINNPVEYFNILINPPVVSVDNKLFELLDNVFNHIALKGSNIIKVYVNDIRQYGTYEELTEFDISGSGDIDYVHSINFFNEVLPLDVVSIELSAGSTSDINKEAVYVRTELDDDIFDLLPTSQQTELLCIVQYRKQEQIKYTHTQYPLFNMFNVDGSFNGVSPLFSYHEGEEYDSQPAFNGIRVAIVNNSTNNYQFKQHLIKDDDKLLSYVDYDTIDVDNPLGLNTIWKAGTGIDEFYIPRFVDSQNRENGDVFINSEGNEEIAVVNASNGDWEIPNTLYFNASHANRSTLSFSEMLTHFATIIDGQYVPIGFKNTNRLWRIIENPTYGKGGTIKEHNNGYDTFLSSMFVDTGTTLDVINFANVTYTNFINSIMERFYQLITNSLLNSDPTVIDNLTTTITNILITEHEQNDSNVNVFGDSHTYNDTLSTGIHNWIASRSFLGLTGKVQPELLRDDVLGIYDIIHHDGHVSRLSLPMKTENTILLSIRTTPHNNTPKALLDTWLLDPLTYVVELENAYWMNTTTIRPDVWDYNNYLTNLATRRGQYWFGLYGTSTINSLYRFQLKHISANQPSLFEDDGTLWFDIITNLLMIRDSSNINVWIPVSNIPYDVTDAWILIDMKAILSSTMLEIEERLYDAVDEVNKFDIQDYILTPQNQIGFDNHMESFFLDYTIARDIPDPFINKSFDLFDAFSWNYSGVNSLNIYFPTTSTVWGSTWFDIYSKLFNTQYPHLQPWKLQGYDVKPTWWGTEYDDPSRRWTPIMWSNILAGIVPVSYNLPNGNMSTAIPGEVSTYSHVCVNIGNTTIDGYNPDDLLPPFIDDTISVVLAGYTLIRQQSSIPDNVTTFPGTTLINNNFPYGDNGIVEWEWKQSNTYPHDILKSCYLLYPVTFLNTFFGTNTTSIGGLDVDVLTEKVYSHDGAILHGDLLTANTIYISHGINQWYINYNRFNGFDNKLSDFRDLWTQWNPIFAYQFDTFIDTNSFDMASSNFELDSNDFQIIIKKTAGLYNAHFDSLHITTTHFTPTLGVDPNDKGEQWEFAIQSPALQSPKISFYSVNGANQIREFDTLMNNKFRTWFHYEIDRNTVNNATFPINIIGIQNVINFIDGYVAYVEDLGFQFYNVDETTTDVDTGKLVGWQTEIERWIAFNYKMRSTIFSDITSTVYNPIFELNPVRNTITFNHPKGVLANVITGPFNNNTTDSTIYDQYGRPLTNNQLMVFRNDKSSQIVIRDGLPNDVELNNSPYNFLHLGGLTLHLDAYEHVLLLNNYSLNGNLVYDPFLGLNTKRYLVSFDKQLIQTQRPHIGGYYLTDDKFERNMEGSIELIQTYYDTYQTSETDSIIQQSRKLIQYEYPTYLDHININSKSAFLFWKGLIQSKGSTKIIDAIVNSKHFIGADIDEFWAFKLAEFGDTKTRLYPELRINSDDVEQDKLKLHFTDSVYDPIVKDGFTEITRFDDTRWFNYPEISIHFNDTSANFHFDAAFQQRIDLAPDQMDGSDNVYVFDYVVDDIIVIHSGGILVNGIGYEKINSFIFKIFNYASLVDVSIFTINPSTSKMSPGKLRDVASEVIVDTIPVWDPIRNHHEYKADHIIDLKLPYDPAKYTTSIISSNTTVKEAWNVPELDTIWLNTEHLDYLPYYDETRIPNVDDRMLLWGRLAPWSTVKMYSWTESDVHPSVWDQHVLNELEDDTIPSNLKDSGIAKKILYKRTRDNVEVSFAVHNVASTTVDVDPAIFATLKKGDVTELTFSSYEGYVDLYIDGSVIPVTVPFIVDGSQCQTYGELASQIQLDLSNYPIIVSIDNNAINFVSTDKSIRNIVVGDVDLFVALERFGTPTVTNTFPVSGIIAQDSVLIPLLGVPSWFQDGLSIFLFTDDTLPEQLEVEQQYTLHEDVALSTWLLKDSITDTIISLTDVGTGVHIIANTTFDDSWIVEQDQHAEFFNALEPTHDYIIQNPNIFFRDVVDVYVNGLFVNTSTIDIDNRVDTSGLTLGVTLIPKDVVHIVKTPYSPSTADLEFNPIVEDTGEFLSQYKFDYEYTIINKHAVNGVDLIPTYYFWVSDVITRIKDSLSLVEASVELTLPTNPYMVVQNLFKTGTFVDFNKSIGYNQLIIRGLSTKVTTSDRFVLRLLKDLTLRDDLNDGSTALSLKNKHIEWFMFRQKQIQHIPLTLWNRMIESVMGYELRGFDDGVRTAVPSVDRVLYDELYGTTFRYGLEDGQAFTDPTIAINTIISIFEDPIINLDPVDKEFFLETYSFNTPENIKISLEYIYNIFPSEHVNFIMFELIQDALSLTSKYPGLFKTSAIALTGIKLLESAGNVIDEF